MKGEGPAAELHVASEPDTPPARPGAGGAHHVALPPFLEQRREEIEAGLKPLTPE